MTQHKHPHLDAFISLTWYDTLLRFISNFIAKTSELLLGAGLVVSSVNFLTDGSILGTQTPASEIWAWAQALAIDSSLAISFYQILSCIKQKDWIRTILYSLLTGLLALVAGTFTNIDIFSHAIHVSMNSAMTSMGLNVEALSILRSITVVGFVLMSRLRDVSFKDLTAPETEAHSHSNGTSQTNLQEQQSQPAYQTNGNESRHFTIDDVALLIQIIRQETARTHITIEPDGTTAAPSSLNAKSQQLDLIANEASSPQNQSNQSSAKQIDQKHLKDPGPSGPLGDLTTVPHHHQTIAPEPGSNQQSQTQEDPATLQENISNPAFTAADPGSREERLEQAYQTLLTENIKVSGRTLAQRAHMHRSICSAWLKEKNENKRDHRDQQHSSTEENPRTDDEIEPAP